MASVNLAKRATEQAYKIGYGQFEVKTAEMARISFPAVYDEDKAYLEWRQRIASQTVTPERLDGVPLVGSLKSNHIVVTAGKAAKLRNATA